MESKKKYSPPSVPAKEGLVVRVVSFPKPLRAALRRELKTRGWTMRQMMHHVEQTRLDETVTRLKDAGFPYAKPGSARGPVKLRIPKAVHDRLQAAEEHTGLAPVSILYLLLAAELRD